MNGARKLVAYLIAIVSLAVAEGLRLAGLPVTDQAIDTLVPLLAVFVGGNGVEHIVDGIRARRAAAEAEAPAARPAVTSSAPGVLVLALAGALAAGCGGAQSAGLDSSGEAVTLEGTGSGSVSMRAAEGAPLEVSGDGRVELAAEASTTIVAGAVSLPLGVTVHALADATTEGGGTGSLVVCAKQPQAQTLLRLFFGFDEPLCIDAGE